MMPEIAGRLGVPAQGFGNYGKGFNTEGHKDTESTEKSGKSRFLATLPSSLRAS
jgi:hypothetical protein